MTDTTRKANSAYLLNVAETIQQQLLPQLSGQAHARALDCLNVALRVAVSIDSEADAAASPEAQAKSWDADNAGFAKLLDGVARAAPPSRPTLEAEGIQTFLRGNTLGGPKLKVLEAKLLPGGRSKMTATVVQEGAAQLPRDLVIRKDWMALAGTSVSAEFPLLQKLFEHGIKVPQPLILEANGAALGTPFIVVARVDGAPHGNILTPPPDDAKVFAAAAMLGKIHALGAVPFESVPGICERHFTAEQLSTSLAGFRSVIEQFHLPRSPMLSEVFDWLAHTLPRVTGSRVLVHGDYGFHNLLFVGSELNAVLDLELAHLGNPAYDLGYLRSVVEQQVEWSAFLEHYHAAGGPKVDDFTVNWYALYTSLWLYHVLVQARAGVVAGVLHDIEIVSVCAHIGPPLLAQVAHTLRRARLENV